MPVTAINNFLETIKMNIQASLDGDKIANPVLEYPFEWEITDIDGAPIPDRIRLNAKLGVYGVTGNGEFFIQQDTREGQGSDWIIPISIVVNNELDPRTISKNGVYGLGDFNRKPGVEIQPNPIYPENPNGNNKRVAKLLTAEDFTQENKQPNLSIKSIEEIRELTRDATRAVDNDNLFEPGEGMIGVLDGENDDEEIAAGVGVTFPTDNYTMGTFEVDTRPVLSRFRMITTLGDVDEVSFDLKDGLSGTLRYNRYEKDIAVGMPGEYEDGHIGDQLANTVIYITKQDNPAFRGYVITMTYWEGSNGGGRYQHIPGDCYYALFMIDTTVAKSYIAYYDNEENFLVGDSYMFSDLGSRLYFSQTMIAVDSYLLELPDSWLLQPSWKTTNNNNRVDDNNNNLKALTLNIESKFNNKNTKNTDSEIVGNKELD